MFANACPSAFPEMVHRAILIRHIFLSASGRGSFLATMQVRTEIHISGHSIVGSGSMRRHRGSGIGDYMRGTEANVEGRKSW